MAPSHPGRPQGRHRSSSPAPRDARHLAAKGPVLLSKAVRRPLASAAVVVAVVAATAAGFATVHGPQTIAASFTASPAAAAQAAELASNQSDTNAELAVARRSGVQRASALTKQQQVAAAARTAALMKARKDAAERASRAKARVGILARAQADPRAVGALMVADRGWGSAQFACLNSLWTKESNWRWNADNPGSSAYGIPQSLPGSKMASAGNDWATNPITQITWGLGYIAKRYGTPCSAWAQSRASNWY